VVRGKVKEWNEDLGWGVLLSPDVPGEVWAHFMHIDSQGAFRSLDAGAAVEFDFIAPPGGQDGFLYRATWVRQLPSESR
jgi:CspA family cold shock protein